MSYKRGIVEEVDFDSHRARVRFDDEAVVSGWLDVLVRDTLDDKEFSLPSKGAQVAVMLDEKSEAGCVLGAVYSQTDAPSSPKNEDVRHWTFKDGTQISYDRSAHKLSIELTANGLVEIGGDAAEALVREDLLGTLFNAHVHPTGVGPSGPPAVPLGPTDVAATTIKAK